ncbi:MAG: hypothetical protein HYZ92_05645 [Candidatus Omnitrophica bacterium]|nr:hypothetical protein [Candidatus Omnitrophota bacterium]
MQVELHITASAVAWYGAIVATTSLLVSGYAVWRDRVRVKVTAKGGWRAIGLSGGSTYPYDSNENHISVNVVNVGRRSVTIVKAGLRERRGGNWLVAADSMKYSVKELTEGKSCEFLFKESQVDTNNIACAFAQDATGKMYKGKFMRGDAASKKQG